MAGWIKLHRKILDNPIWTSEKFTRGQAWIDLLLLANHEYGYFYLRDHKIEIQRGQVGWSQLKLSLRWNWSRNKVKKFLNDLEKEQQIKQQQTKSTSIITIINYDYYQQKEQQVEQQQDNSRTTEGQQLEHKQEEIRIIKNNKENNINNNDFEKKFNEIKNSEPKKIPFDTWWKLYDKNVGENICRSLWVELDDETRSEIIKHTKEYVSYYFKTFRKNPDKYLKEETWRDEIVKPIDNKTKNEKPKFDKTDISGYWGIKRPDPKI